MSSDRRCMMSDLRAAEARLGRQISKAESAARRAQSAISSVQSDMRATQRQVRGLASDLRSLSGEVSAQRDQLYQLGDEMVHLRAQQNADRRRIAQNAKMVDALRQDLAELDQDVAENRQLIQRAEQAIEVLDQETALAHQRIDRNDQHIQQLHAGVQRIDNYLEAERQRREAESQAKRDDIAVQSRLAAELRAQLDPAEVRFYGAYNEYLSALTQFDRAEDNQRKGNLEAALAGYQQGLTTLEKIARDLDARKRAFEDKRAQCAAAVRQLEDELGLLDREDTRTWYPAEFAQLQKRFDVLQANVQNKSYEGAGEPVEVRAALDQLTTQATQIYQDVRLLDDSVLERISEHEERKTRVRDIMQALRKVWDQDFAYDLAFLNENDPKSTLKLQTQRPGAPNVTVYLDLDGSVQFAWTGYEGLRCLEDVEQFEQVMRQDHHVVVELVGEPINQPDKPNPDLGGGGGKVYVSIPRELQQEQDRQRQG